MEIIETQLKEKNYTLYFKKGLNFDDLFYFLKKLWCYPEQLKDFFQRAGQNFKQEIVLLILQKEKELLEKGNEFYQAQFLFILFNCLEYSIVNLNDLQGHLMSKIGLERFLPINLQNRVLLKMHLMYAWSNEKMIDQNI